MKIGIDTLGGDFAPYNIVLGVIKAKKVLSSDVSIVLIGDEYSNKEIIEKEGEDVSKFHFIHTKEEIGMNEHPAKAFNKKINSSISIGFKLLKNNEIDSFCSVGNTGAMLVGSMFSVKTISGIIRPCITTTMPQQNGKTAVILDVGINADCKPDVMYQFGILGKVFSENVYNVEKPRVGLLNIGEEKEKGNILTQATHKLMIDSNDFNFIGNIEGRDLFNSKADVIVCDGFTGNIILKEAEAFYNIYKNMNVKDEYLDKLNYETYGGSPVLGINSSVIIGHGNSSSEAIKNMLKLSKNTVEINLSGKIKKAFCND